MIKESYAAYSCYTYTYLNIGGLEVDEEKVASHETNRNPNPKSQKPQNGTKETHFNSILFLSAKLCSRSRFLSTTTTPLFLYSVYRNRSIILK